MLASTCINWNKFWDVLKFYSKKFHARRTARRRKWLRLPSDCLDEKKTRCFCVRFSSTPCIRKFGQVFKLHIVCNPVST